MYSYTIQQSDIHLPTFFIYSFSFHRF
ncbi:hypothetical protein FWK35_00038711 [Aphis craccivora]|uniref:Uncharacterized protein n=1 Tax=Aphis craccivora TaxID=307492 RepID=A0A6G0VJ63_APHCR|nr:hypothetical protein FWK35_00038711 [Aphis craccivora]